MTAISPTLAAPLDDHRPAFARLTLIELRKMVDTRAGRWLLGILGLVIAGLAVVYAFAAPERDESFRDLFLILQIPPAVLLPVLGVLSATSEWSQRTGLTTFVLVPDRRRVIAAKALAVCIPAVAALVVAAVAAAAGTVIGGFGDWSLGIAPIGEVLVLQLVGMLSGFAFGLALQSSAPAIVLYFVLPTIIGVLVQIVDALEDVAPWVDFGEASLPFGEGGVTATEWARMGTATVLWALLPLAIGLLRLPRSEIK